jgi:hypothetical protein
MGKGARNGMCTLACTLEKEKENRIKRIFFMGRA